MVAPLDDDDRPHHPLRRASDKALFAPEPWDEYRRLVLAELARLHESIESVKKELNSMNIKELAEIKAQLAVLQLKASLFGAVAGIVGTGIVEFTLHKFS